MTCHDTLALLEDYLDNELSSEKAESVKIHLRQCPDCQNEFDSLRRLKELLNNTQINMPGTEYWDETSKIILAKTVESEPWELNQSETQTVDIRKQAFVRSLVSVAASLVILFISLYVGSSQDKAITLENQTSPVLATYETSPVNNFSNDRHFTREDQLSHLKGMIIMGSPGLIGHLALADNLSLNGE